MLHARKSVFPSSLSVVAFVQKCLQKTYIRYKWPFIAIHVVRDMMEENIMPAGSSENVCDGRSRGGVSGVKTHGLCCIVRRGYSIVVAITWFAETREKSSRARRAHRRRTTPFGAFSRALVFFRRRCALEATVTGVLCCRV